MIRTKSCSYLSSKNISNVFFFHDGKLPHGAQIKMKILFLL